MHVTEGLCHIATKSHHRRQEGLATVTLNLGVPQNQKRCRQGKCDNKPSDSELPSTNNVTGKSRIRVSDLFYITQST